MPLISRTFDQLIDFTRTTAATYVNSAGLVTLTPPSVNLLLYTQEFDNPAWTKSATDVTANSTVAPDGTLTADTLTAGSGAGSGQQVYQALSTIGSDQFVYSIYAKQGSGATDSNTFVVRNHTTSTDYARVTVNYATGVVTQVTGSGATMTSAGNGWWRLSIPFTSTATVGNAIRFFVGSTGGVETPGEFVFIWGAQLELGSAATDYTRNVGGLFPARFDYDPVTLAPRGFLIEEQRSNLFTYSAQFDDAGAWNKVNGTVSANATTSPDGTANADAFVEDGTTSLHYVQQSIAFTSGVTYTLSVYIKPSTRAWLQLFFPSSAFSGGIASYFNLAGAGALGATVGSVAGRSITAVGNGWYRVTLSAAATATTSGNVAIIPSAIDGSASYTGVNGATALFLYGAQLEAGAFATSYIPTVASTVTRTGDITSVTAANFSSWYNQPSGTFVIDMNSFAPVSLSTRQPLAVNDGTGSNYVRTYSYNTVWGANVVTGGAAQADLFGSNSYVANATTKLGYALRTNDFAFIINGGSVSTDTSVSVPAVDRLSIGQFPAVGNQFNGHVRSIRYYPARLNNAQLQTLTA